MIFAFLLLLINSAEVTSYGRHTLSEHFIGVFAAALLVGITHEFAHGTTCKAFGGRATEVGVLMIYYFLPALYCNVSGIHLIPKRRQRLWVIAAGVYWQLMVGTAALLAWFCLAPHMLLAEIAFIFYLGSVLEIIFNANPLIKLDGYYFLSQWLRLPNLMDRSRAYWRGVLKRMLFGERNEAAARYDRRERVIYLIFGFLSFIYNIAFASLIVVFAGEWLIDRFYLLGLLMTAIIALIFARRPVKEMFQRLKSLPRWAMEGNMADNNQTTAQNSGKDTKPPFWRRRLAPISIALAGVVVLLMPWSASVGNYGTLIAIPNQEQIIRAPESATLSVLNTQPGVQVTRGEVIGRMGNLELDEQIVQVQSELARVNADYDRLLGELRAREETATRAELQLRQRRLDYEEIDAEHRQIAARHHSETASGTPKAIPVSVTVALPYDDPSRQPDLPALRYPAALAVLQSDVDLRRAQLNEANTQLGRARRLYADGLMPRSELDAAETRASTLAIELAGARDRLEAALIEHRRKYIGTETEMSLARSDAGAAALQIEKLSSELQAMRNIISMLEARRDLLRRRQAQFELVAQQSGVIFGEDLPRMVGQYFQKGAEICRVADTNQLLVRIQVPEREIGDVRAGYAVRLKARSFPDRVFHGTVSKIGSESEQGQYGQAIYRVEVTIENFDGSLRPGMTAFARIDFDRQVVGRILLHKIKQALRPELWML